MTMRVIYRRHQDGTLRHGDLQQWIYHPDVGALAVILEEDGQFTTCKMPDVKKAVRP